MASKKKDPAIESARREAAQTSRGLSGMEGTDAPKDPEPAPTPPPETPTTKPAAEASPGEPEHRPEPSRATGQMVVEDRLEGESWETDLGSQEIEQTDDAQQVVTTEEVLKTLRSLDPKAQESLQKMGFVIPMGDVSPDNEGRFKLGYRCANCNQIGLYFVGTKWLHPDQEMKPYPPLSVPLSRIAWTQDLPSEKIDRAQPRCQRCATRLTLDQGKLRAKLVVHVETFEKSRDESFDKRLLRRLRRQLQGTPMVDGDGNAISGNYDLREARNMLDAAVQRGHLTRADVDALPRLIERAGLENLQVTRG